MKRTLATALAFALSLGAFAAQAQNGPQQHGDQGPSQQHAPADHGSFNKGGKPQQFNKGQKLPSQYRGNDRVVSDYNANHLSAPPHGYHWVRDDSGNFVLVAIATGEISQILSGH